MLNQIFNEDCLEGMKRIPNNSIDLIITDPPYCVGTTSNGHKGSWNDNNLIKPFFDLLFAEWDRVLKEEAEIYINTDWRTYPFLYPIVQKYFRVRNLIVWDYEWVKSGNFYRFSHEFIIYATKGDHKRRFYAGERDVWRIKPINYTNLKTKLHQAQKPIELVEKMLTNSSVEGDIVLDCFMGSGTTGVACINLDRQFIGFEIDEKYFAIAKKRMEEAYATREMRLNYETWQETSKSNVNNQS